jgi:hypothetical protein
LRILITVEFIEAPLFTALIAEYLEDDESGRYSRSSRASRKPAMSCQGPVAFASSDGPIDAEARVSVVASG